MSRRRAVFILVVLAYAAAVGFFSFLIAGLGNPYESCSTSDVFGDWCPDRTTRGYVLFYLSSAACLLSLAVAAITWRRRFGSLTPLFVALTLQAGTVIAYLVALHV